MSESPALQNGLTCRVPGRGALGHIVPAQVLLAVFAALLLLTAATVAVTWVDLGPWNLAAAMAIATLKASLVAMYFMHLRYDHPFNALIFVSALGCLALFIVLTLMDTIDAEPDVEQFRQSPPGAAAAFPPPRAREQGPPFSRPFFQVGQRSAIIGTPDPSEVSLWLTICSSSRPASVSSLSNRRRCGAACSSIRGCRPTNGCS